MRNDLEELNRKHEEYIRTHLFRQMRKQCQEELKQKLLSHTFDCELVSMLSDYVYLSINSIFEFLTYQN